MIEDQTLKLNVSKHKRYKTIMCMAFSKEAAGCHYGDKCQFAHGKEELRTVEQNILLQQEEGMHQKEEQKNIINSGDDAENGTKTDSLMYQELLKLMFSKSEPDINTNPSSHYE